MSNHTLRSAASDSSLCHQGATQVSIRLRNRTQLLNLLRHREMTRSELSAASGLTGAAVSRISRELIDADLVLERKRSDQYAGAGRRGFTLAINPVGAFVVGVTITANRLSVALGDLSGRVLQQRNVPHVDIPDPAQVLDSLVIATRKLMADNHKDRRCDFDQRRVLGIGVSMAVSSGDSISRAEDGKVFVSSRALSWHNVDVATAFTDYFKLPVKVEPRAVAILRSETNVVACDSGVDGPLFGGDGIPEGGGQMDTDYDAVNAPGSRSVYLVNVGLGIGSATQVDRKIYGGSSKVGDLAHLAHPDFNFECECGRSGCLLHMATGASVVRELGARPLRENSGTNTLKCSQTLSALNPALITALDLAKQGDPTARRAFFNAGARLAYGLDLVHALLEPDEFILAGEIGRQDDYVAGVRTALDRYSTPIQYHQLRVSQSTSPLAAISTALEVFAFSSVLNLDKLKCGNASANAAVHPYRQREVVA